MDTGFAIATSTLIVGGTLAIGATGGPTVLLLVKLAVLRRPFARSASWWVDTHRARPVRRHAARLAWTDPVGRAATVRAGWRLRVAVVRGAVARLTVGVPPFGSEWVTA